MLNSNEPITVFFFVFFQIKIILLYAYGPFVIHYTAPVTTVTYTKKKKYDRQG